LFFDGPRTGSMEVTEGRSPNDVCVTVDGREVVFNLEDVMMTCKEEAEEDSAIISEVVAQISPMNSITESTPPFSPLSTPEIADGNSPSDEDDDDPTYEPSMTVVSPLTKRPRGRKPDAATASMSKKERKRLQNKKAATRYREKKRQEVEIVEDVEDTLEKRNAELRAEVTKLEHESTLLKNLLRDVLRTKGLWPPKNK